MLCYHLSDLECGHQLSPCYLCSAQWLSQINKTNKYFYHQSSVLSLTRHYSRTWWWWCSPVAPVDIFTLLSPWRVIILNTMAPFNLVTFLPSLLCDAATDCSLPQLSSCKNTQIFIWKENVDTAAATTTALVQQSSSIQFILNCKIFSSDWLWVV